MGGSDAERDRDPVALGQQLRRVVERCTATARSPDSSVRVSAFRPPGKIGNYGVIEIGQAVRTYLRDLRSYGPGVAGVIGSASTGGGHLGGSGMSEEEIADRLDPDR